MANEVEHLRQVNKELGALVKRLETALLEMARIAIAKNPTGGGDDGEEE